MTRPWLYRLCLAIIRACYRVRDEAMADEIHRMASQYQRRPEEGWKP